MGSKVVFLAASIGALAVGLTAPLGAQSQSSPLGSLRAILPLDVYSSPLPFGVWTPIVVIVAGAAVLLAMGHLRKPRSN
jgi:hypothetical protein